MKKVYVFAALLAATSFSFAGINGVTELQRQKEMLIGKGIISRGFYLHIGLAFPSQTINISSITVSNGTSAQNYFPNKTYNLGVQPNIEIGNQWYFWKNDKMGVGLRVSWLQFGYSSYDFKLEDPTGILGTFPVSLFDVRLIKVAPQFTLALADKMALDFSLEITPTILLGTSAVKEYKFGPSTTKINYATSSFGILFTPGVRFRYQIFAVGFDLSIGSLGHASTLNINSTIVSGTSSSSASSSSVGVGSASMFYPRIFAGFKF